MKNTQLTTREDRTERGYFALLAVAIIIILMGMAAMSCTPRAYNFRAHYAPHTCPAYR